MKLSLGVKVEVGVDIDVKGEVKGFWAETWVHGLQLINSLMGADRTCAAIK